MTIWVRLGISVAVAAIFCIAATEILPRAGYYEAYRWQICAGFFAVGSLVFLIGRKLNAQAGGPAHAGRISLSAESEERAEFREPFLLFNLAYWGVMLVLFGGILCFIVPRPVLAVAATETIPPPTPAAPARIKVPPFPDLRMQGLVYHPRKASVIFEGRTYAVGEQVQGVKVVAISSRTVTLEWRGQSRVLDLERELIRRH